MIPVCRPHRFALPLARCSLLLGIAWAWPLVGTAADYDLLIRVGRVVDGSGNPWFHGDVAIRGDRIVQVGNAAGSATREVDARGLVVAPGFVGRFCVFR